MAAFVVLIAQFGLVGAGVADGRQGASAASHLESGGTNLHFAHNEADCFMCRAQHLGDGTPFSAPALNEAPVLSPIIAIAGAQFVARRLLSSNTSRAPPSGV